MNEKARQMVFIGALILATIYGCYNLLSPGTDMPEPTSAELTPAATLSTTPEQPNYGLIDVAMMETLAWGDDPFRTERPTDKLIKEPRRKEPLWNLSGIVFNPTNPMAIINKKTVAVGDIIDKATVRRIESKTVILEYQGVHLTLTVNKG